MAINDCGTRSLSVLLGIEDRPTELKRIESLLPAPPFGGYTMKDLRDAARGCDVTLTGVRPSRRDLAPDLPALVLLVRGPYNHFAVVHPGGHTRKLAQVIDTSYASVVIDDIEIYSFTEFTDLSSSHEWTGLALVPARLDWALWTAWILALVWFVSSS